MNTSNVSIQAAMNTVVKRSGFILLGSLISRVNKGYVNPISLSIPTWSMKTTILSPTVLSSMWNYASFKALIISGKSQLILESKLFDRLVKDSTANLPTPFLAVSRALISSVAHPESQSIEVGIDPLDSQISRKKAFLSFMRDINMFMMPRVLFAILDHVPNGVVLSDSFGALNHFSTTPTLPTFNVGRSGLSPKQSKHTSIKAARGLIDPEVSSTLLGTSGSASSSYSTLTAVFMMITQPIPMNPDSILNDVLNARLGVNPRYKLERGDTDHKAPAHYLGVGVTNALQATSPLLILGLWDISPINVYSKTDILYASSGFKGIDGAMTSFTSGYVLAVVTMIQIVDVKQLCLDVKYTGPITNRSMSATYTLTILAMMWVIRRNLQDDKILTLGKSKISKAELFDVIKVVFSRRSSDEQLGRFDPVMNTLVFLSTMAPYPQDNAEVENDANVRAELSTSIFSRWTAGTPPSFAVSFMTVIAMGLAELSYTMRDLHFTTNVISMATVVNPADYQPSPLIYYVASALMDIQSDSYTFDDVINVIIPKAASSILMSNINAVNTPDNSIKVTIV